MAKRLVDDSVFDADQGDNRIYFRITDNLRLRSHDSRNVVLELFGPVQKRSGEKTYGWRYAGYFQEASGLYHTARWHTNDFTKYGRKLNRKDSYEKAIVRYWAIWQHFNTSGVSRSEMDNFIREAKEHERKKAQESGNKAKETKKLRDSAGSIPSVV